MYWVPGSSNGPGTKVRSDITFSHSRPATSPMCRACTSTKTWRGNRGTCEMLALPTEIRCSFPHSTIPAHQSIVRERNNGGDRNSGGSVAPARIAHWRWTLRNFIICLPSSESDPAGTSRAAARCWSASTQNNVSGTSRPSAHCMY